MTITTTLNRIRAHRPCREGWENLLKGLGKTAADDEPLPFSRIVEINGTDDAIWCMRAEPHHAQQWRLFVVFCCRQTHHLMSDHRSLTAIDAAVVDAWEAAEAAAREAAWVAAQAAAGVAAWEAAREAAWDAERAAAQAAAVAAALAAAGAAVGASAREAQRKELLRIVA